MKKRILSMLLTAVMLLSLFAVPAFAEEVPLYEYFGYLDEAEFMEYEFWYASNRGFTYEEAEAAVRAQYVEILADPQLAYDYWGTTPEELEGVFANGYAPWTDYDSFYWYMALSMANDASFDYIPPVSVQLDGEKVLFPDAAPEITDGRTMVPFRAIAEEMGFTVSFDNGAIVGSDGGTSVAFTVGETACVVTKASGTETVTMDTAPYIKEDRTYVPVRFFAEAMGMTVVWDGEYQVAVIYDKEAWIEKMDEDFTVYNEMLLQQKESPAITPEDFEMAISMAMNITMFSTLNGDKTYPVNVETTFIKEGQKVQGDLVLDILELVNLIAEISGASTEEMEASLMGMETYLQEIEAEFIFNMDEGKLYIQCPAINYIFAMTGDVAITDADKAWLVTSEFSELIDTFPSDFSEYYAQIESVDSMGELLMLMNAPEEQYWPSLGLEDLLDMKETMELFCGDSVYTKKGNEYTATWDYTDEDFYADDYDIADETIKGTMVFNTKTGASTVDMEIRSNGGYSSDMLMKITGKGKGNDMEVTVSMHVDNAFLLEFILKTKMTDVKTSPLSEPPKGAVIIDIDNL